MKEARERAASAKKTLADGKDPSMERKREALQFQTTFEIVAREWHEKQAHKWASAYYKRTIDNLEKNADLHGALAPHVRKHHPAITDPDKVGELLLKIDDYHGMAGVRCALQLMALTFCRSAEIRHAEWSEFDFTDKLWRIPAAKMKMSRDHIVRVFTYR